MIPPSGPSSLRNDRVGADPGIRSDLRLTMAGIRRSFGATVALAGVDLAVGAGEVHALIGENGAGKSTLMKVLSGALLPDAGRMTLDGEPYAPRTPADGREAGVAMIYQELSLAPHLTVAENIFLGREPVAGPFVRRRITRQMAGDALNRIGRSDMALDTPVGQLPAAGQQQVEIARAVATGCRVLVLDEPTSSLTRADIGHLFTLIGRLRSDGIAVVYISHVLEEVREISDTFTVLRDGQVTGRGETAVTPVDRIVTLMVGRDITALYPRSRREPGEPLLTVRSLSGAALPREANLELRRGEVLGIAGLVGSGRTELVRTIFGLDEVRSGEVRVAHLAGGGPPRMWAEGVGMVSEDRAREGLAAGLSLADNLTLPHLKGLGPRGLVTPAGQDRAARTWIESLPIRCSSPRQPVATLSGGNQQKVALARLLHAGCDVLLLDEPTRGIDVGSKALIYGLIDELAGGNAAAGVAPRAIVMVSSYLPELLGICDSVAVMRRGRLGPARPVTGLDEQAIMYEATGTEEAA